MSKKTKKGVCPTCGKCPTCGEYHTYPPVYPYWYLDAPIYYPRYERWGSGKTTDDSDYIMSWNSTGTG